jgi:hypothetical protein
MERLKNVSGVEALLERELRRATALNLHFSAFIYALRIR